MNQYTVVLTDEQIKLIRWAFKTSNVVLGTSPSVEKEDAIAMIAQLDNLDEHLYNTIMQQQENLHA